MKNKGFSLVELIIVIAIMAILAAAIAPALIRYIDKSRRGDDVQAAATINTAVTATLANEAAYDAAAANMKTGGKVLATANAHSANSSFVKGSGLSSVDNKDDVFVNDLNSNLGGEAPQIKYIKDFNNGTTTLFQWEVYANDAGKPVVKLSTGNNKLYELQPSIDPSYK